jgi:azurin
VKPGARIKLVFNNNDDMLHNFVMGKPGTADKIGEASLKLGLDGERISFIPSMPEVLVHTILLHPKETDAIYFKAPDKPGQYPYICTYPGHYLVMRGVMKVQ